MKRRVLSLFMSFVFCISLLPAAVFAEDDGEGNYVAEAGENKYEALQDALDEFEENITLLCNVEEDINNNGPAIIDMAGFSITGNVEADGGLTLKNGTVVGSVKVDASGEAFIMTAPADAEIAIADGLKVIDGACSVSGAKIGVNGTLYVDSADEVTVTGTDKAVLLSAAAEPQSKALYGSADENGDTSVEAVFDTDTYKVGGAVAKKLSNKQVGGSAPEPSEETITLTPETQTIFAGQNAEFTAAYNGTDTLTAYIQKSGIYEEIDAAAEKTETQGEWKITVPTTEATAAGEYKLYVHATNNTFVSKEAIITVNEAVAKDSDGNYYGNMKSAITSAADGSTVTVIAKKSQLPLPDEIYADTGSDGITLDLNGHSLDGHALNVGGYNRTGKLIVKDSSGGNGAVGLEVRSGGTLIFNPGNVNTTLLQLVAYGGTIELYGGRILASGLRLENDCTLAGLLPSGKGLAFSNETGSKWIALTDAQNKNFQLPSYNLIVTQCEHADIDADNNCLYCGQAMAAKNGGKYYTSVKAAVDEANANDTVTLLKNADEVFYIEKNIAINLGDSNHMLDGNITVKSGSTLTLKGSGTVSIVQSGYELGTSGTAAKDLIGGALNVLSDEVHVGSLIIEQRTIPEMHLSHGSFGKIKLTDNLKDTMTLSEILAEGYAFASYGSGEVENGYVQELNNVKVVAHEHDTSVGPCVCGFTCAHTKGYTDNGKCPDCGEECPHTNVDATTYICGGCKQQMVVKTEKTSGAITYGMSIAAAMNAAENGTTVTLLTNTVLDKDVFICGIGTTVTLNLNGHSVDRSTRYVLDIGGTGVSEMEKGGTLAIVGAGNFLSNIIVLTSGTLDLSGWRGQDLNYLAVYENSSVTGIPSEAYIGTMCLPSFKKSEINEIMLSGGSYGEISWQNFKNIDLSLSSLLAPGYAFRRENGDLVPYSEKLASPVQSIYNVSVVKCTDHADSDGDGRCDYCNGKFVVSIAKNNGESRIYTNLQDALDTIDSDLYTVTLLDDVSGSYTLASSCGVTFKMNGKTVDELVFSGNAKVALNDKTGAVNSIIFRGGSTGFNAGSQYIKIKKLTVADGATWSSISPYPNDIRGYKVYSDDLSSYTWYDKDTVGDRVSLSNVYVYQLPIYAEPKLMIDGAELNGESNVSVYKPLDFGFKASVTDFYGGKGAVFIQKEGESEPTRIDAAGDDDNNFNCPSHTFDISEIGTYKIWAEVSKEGYTRKSGKYTLNVEANLSEAVVELENPTEFTYTPLVSGGAEEFAVKVKSVKLYDHEIPNTEYTVGGDKGTDAGEYTLTVTANAASAYTGYVSTGWKILQRVLTRIVACDYIKSYDGTTAVNADNIGKNDLPPHFHYEGGPVAGIVLEYEKDYNITSVTANYADANAESHCDVSFTVELTNPNYTFRDENDKDTKTKSVTQGMNIGKATSLPQGCEPESGSITVRNGAAHTYTFDVSKLLKTLPDRLNYGTKKFRLKNTNILDGGYIDDNTVNISENGILTVPVKEVQKLADAEIAIVTINVVVQNYRDFPVTVMVNAKNKLVPTGNPTLSKNGEITYGDTIDKISLSGRMKGEENEVVEGTFEWKTPTAKPASVGDYEAEWTFTPNGDNAYMYASTTGKATIKVNKAAFPVDKIKVRPEKIEGLVYKYKTGGNAEPQVLHTAGSVEDGWGTMMYTTVNPETAAPGDWQTTPISAVDAGDYTIYYKVLGTENYLDSDYGTIKCHIEKYELGYNVICKKKIYDETTEAEFESIKFYPYSSVNEEVKFSSEDYEVKNLKYNSPNVGSGFGKGAVEASGDVSLNDTPATRNYKLKGSGRIYGYIKPAVFADIANFHDYELEIRYNDMTPKTFGAKAFGAQKDDGYIVNSDGTTRPGTDKELNGKIGRRLNEDGTCYFFIAEPLTEAHIGKKFVEKMRINSADGNYCSDPDGEQTLSVIITIVGKATPDLLVDPISADYDGKPVSADKIVGTATYNGTEVKGTWSWKDGNSPTNVDDSGEYTVVFTPVDADAYHSATTVVDVTVNPCTTAPMVELSQKEYIYDKTEKTPAVTVEVDGKTLVEGKDYEVAYSNNINAEDGAKVTVTAKGNYGFEAVEKSFLIKKTDSVINTVPQAKPFVYDGHSHKLITEGTVSGGTIEYRLEDGEWTKDIPMAEDAGEYTVWYKVVGDSNHNDIAEKSVKVLVDQKDIANADITLGDSLVYNGNDQTQSVKSVKADGLDVTYTVSGNVEKNAGEYTLTITANGNFKGEKIQTFIIERKTVTANVTVNGTYTYNGNAIEPTDITAKDGDTLIPTNEYTMSYAKNTDAGKATVTLNDKAGGNYAVSGTGEFTINKANINVKPKNITKVYGKEPSFELESDSPLIKPNELADFTANAKFTSDGAAKNADVTDGGYEISAVLNKNETKNLILTVSGTGTLTVVPAELTITVNDVSREYGAANPELSVSYEGFIDGEDESVLNGTLVLKYSDKINETADVRLHESATTASGLTAKNYTITYVPGNVTITKIPVNTSAGTARKSYITVVLDRAVEGLTDANFTVKDSENNLVALTNVIATSENKSYVLSGGFEVGKKYTVAVVLSGAEADKTHNIVSGEFTVTPSGTNGGGGGGSAAIGYTVSFDTNGGSKLSSQTVTRNSAIKEPPVPTKEGFDFEGWYTDKELKTKYDFSEKVTKNITLYAAWTEKDNSENQIILTIGKKDASVFGKIKSNDVAPKIVNERTMLPARFVAENLGAVVEWDGDNQLVTIAGKNVKTGADVTILITIGAEAALVNGREVKLDSPAFIENERTYTPVRFISEELGADVEWIESEQKVIITK